MKDRRMLAIMALTFAAYVAISIMRVVTSYRAVEIGLSAVGVGVVGVSYSILPMLFAVSIGRIVDRGNGFRVLLLAAVITAVACPGLAYAHSLPVLILFSALLGIADFQFGVGLQVLCMENREASGAARAISNLMLMIGLGQSVGPAIVGWVGGAAIVPPIQPLFLLAFLIALPMIPAVALLGRNHGSAKPRTSFRHVPIKDILKLPGFYAVLAVSTASSTAQDMIVIYLPLIGAERGFAVSDVGLMMTIRAIAALAARFLFPWLMLGRERQMMIVWLFVAAVSTAVLALPLPLAALHVAVGVSGFAVGLLVITGIARSLIIPKVEARGSASAFRISVMRMGQLVTVLIGSSVFPIIGAAGVFVVLASILGIVGVAIFQSGGEKAGS